MRRSRTGSSEAVVIAATAMLVALGGVGWLYFRAEATERTEQQARLEHDRANAALAAASILLAESEPVANPEDARPLQPLFAAEPVAQVASEPNAIALVSAEEVVAAPAEEPTVQQTVAAHLAVGEFGPAIDAARAVEDAKARTLLLMEIASAQSEAGEFGGALFSIRTMPEDQGDARRTAIRERSEQMSLAGGAANVDFDSLIDLIISLTGAPESWVDLGGPGSVSPFQTGVRVDPNGHLSRLTQAEMTGRLERLALRARTANLHEDMARPSDLRLVSITRLEREVAELIAAGQPIPTTMQYLGGLSRIQYVFVDEASGEIVVGGPAEAWRYNEQGAPVGVDSGRPLLQLDDLVTVLRVFAPGGQRIFACSIVPRKDGLQSVKQFVDASNAAGPLAPGAVRRWTEQIEQRLGTQDVVYEGIPANSRVANVILEADYRMKLVGIGKVDGVAGMKSFFDLLPPAQQRGGVPMDALRWWLTMKYDAVLHSPDRDVYEVQGSSVLCRSENELIADDGERVQTGETEETNRMFAELFTANYGELAARDLVFADLQNVFDLSLVAALVQKERLGERTAWDLGVFARGGAYQPADHTPVLTCDSAVNYKVYRGQHIVVQAAGGVRGDLWSVVSNDEIVREDMELASRTSRGQTTLPDGRWWWDAK